jgi:ATP-dependent Clp protease ATP-binding subunit ClpA
VRILEVAYRKRLSAKHHVTIESLALQAAVILSVRYLPDRRLPDKAIDLLDEACSRVSVPKLGKTPSDLQAQLVTTETIAQGLADWTKLPNKTLNGLIDNGYSVWPILYAGGLSARIPPARK